MRIAFCSGDLAYEELAAMALKAGILSKRRRRVPAMAERHLRFCRSRLCVELLENRTLPSSYTEVEPNNTPATANLVTVPTGDVLIAQADDWLNIGAAIASSSDVDYFRLTLTSRSGLFFDIDSRETALSTTLDSVVTVYDGSGTTILGSNDDGYDFDTGYPAPAFRTGTSPALDSSLYLDLNAGTYYVRVSSFSATTGDYGLRLLADPNYSSTVPVFQSNPGAADTLLLDFDGHSDTDAWGSYTIPPYDFNSNGAEFTPAEKLAIKNVWRIVAEDYSPFALNITTSYAGPFTNGVGFRQVVGNSNGSAIGEAPGTLGVTFRNSYASGTNNNVAFTFASSFSTYSSISGRIMATPVELGNTSSHEFGHALGLRHYGGTNAQPDGIMQTPDTGLNREIWRQGNTHSGESPVEFQDDMAIISNTINTFGYRTDDHGDTRPSATVLASSEGVLMASGIISDLTRPDIDFFRFAAGGPTTVTVSVDEYINNLDVELRLYDASGSLLAAHDPGNSFDAFLSMTLAVGTYYLEVRSDSDPGEAGQYDVRIVTAPPGGQISGQVFNDLNGNGAKESGEPSLPNWTVFLDTNNSGTLDAGEPSASTDSNGTYTFANLPAGTYRARAVVPTGWMLTTANAADIAISSGSNVTGIYFGNFKLITISGQVFNDVNGNGTKETGEPGLQGWTLFLDTNNNGTLDAGESSTGTDASGNYSFANLRAGTYRVREVVQAGYLRTTANPVDLVASSGSNVPDVNFGNRLASQASSTTVTSSANASVFGQTVTFTATVTAVAPATGTPTGTVTFRDGTTNLGTATLTNGTATFAIAALSMGTHAITVVYGGDANFTTSTSATLTQTVNQAATTTAVVSSANPSVVGQAVTFTVTVSAVAPGAGTPTGTVTLRDGTSTLSTATLSNGTATFTFDLTAGSHPISAVYGGDANFATSTSATLTQGVNQTAATTTTTRVTSSANPSVFGQSVTFTATVSPVLAASGTPTGMVTFRDGTTNLFTSALTTSGVATFTTTTLGAGTHAITAVYGGDANFSGSTSATLTQTVNPATTANLQITRALLVDSNNQPIDAPVTGETIFVRAEWTTTNLTASDRYLVRFWVDSIALDSASLTGAPGQGLRYNWYRGGWSASPGAHTVQVTVDGTNAILETNEQDNTTSFSFTTVDQPSGTLSGQAFNDGNHNGTKDTGEVGLPGWTIFIDSNDNGSHDAGETSRVTDASGNYSFTNLAAGTYRVREVLPVGWVQTTLNPGDIVLNSGNTIAGIQFGNFRPPVNPGVKLGTNFAGINHPSSGWVPPDTQVAAGPNHLVQVVNSQIAIYGKGMGTLLFTQSLSSFFSSGSLAPVRPVVLYDELANRFVVGAFQVDESTQTSIFYLAVSNSSNPTGLYETHKINLQQATSSDPPLWADNLRIGWNADAYVVTFNMYTFPRSTAAYRHTQVLTIAKSSVLDANSNTLTKSQVTRSNGTLVGAVMHGSVAGDPMWLVHATWDGGNTVQVTRMTNVLGATPTFTDFDVSVPVYARPGNAVQPGSSGTLFTFDARILHVALRGTRLVAAHNVGTGGATHARWYEFNLSGTPSLRQAGEINPGIGVYTYYPSIEIAANGDLGMTYLQSSSSEFLSMYVTGRTAADPLGTMETPVLVKGGESAYSDFTGSSPYRAGFYSGISVDPTTGTTFWAAHEFATIAVSNNWGTWIASFSLTANGSGRGRAPGQGGDQSGHGTADDLVAADLARALERPGDLFRSVANRSLLTQPWPATTRVLLSSQTGTEPAGDLRPDLVDGVFAGRSPQLLKSNGLLREYPAVDVFDAVLETVLQELI